VHVLPLKVREYGYVSTVIHLVVFMGDMASGPQFATFASLELNVAINMDDKVSV
jgi:hypothetical protein